jgi:hypothetical protein
MKVAGKMRSSALFIWKSDFNFKSTLEIQPFLLSDGSVEWNVAGQPNIQIFTAPPKKSPNGDAISKNTN